ncbi:MAG: tRNA (guanosine(37)-N1)-methyltransferase TrmD [Actinomycetota bacterium]
MRFDVVTIFPDWFESPLRTSLLGKAISSGLVGVELHDLRRWGEGRHRSVDDAPFGGGAGMVMTPGPLVAAAEEVALPGSRILLMSAAGRRLTQPLVEEMAAQKHLVILCGRYEGVDERVGEVLDLEEISIGDFVLGGGEVAALALIEAVARLVTGVVGNLESLREESFASGLLEYPQYTRPAVFRGIPVPEVLTSGDHARIARWRREQALRRTFDRRADLLEAAELDPEQRQKIEEWNVRQGRAD